MPQSESAFSLAREAVIKRLATQRILREQILDYYLRCRDQGLDDDPDKAVYEKVKTLTMADLLSFHEREIAKRKYHLLLLGDEADWDMSSLQQRGAIQRVTLKDIFGY